MEDEWLTTKEELVSNLEQRSMSGTPKKNNRAGQLTTSFIDHNNLVLEVDSQGFSGRFLQ